jgi:anti-sigma B factor antagonist
MLRIERGKEGNILLIGRWDAAQTQEADAFFRTIGEPTVVDFGRLEYISSAGLGILLVTQKRLMGAGGLKLVGMNKHIRDVFRYAGLESVFKIV